jgi:hypothetical protein
MAVALLWLGATISLPAHHSFAAEFDINKPLKLTGVVTRIAWQNPHVWFYMDVKGDADTITAWGLEMGSPNALIRAGWTRNSMKPGEIVTVEAFQARDAATAANARSVTIVSSGKRLFTGSSQPQ